MSWTQSELDALKRAYASGTLRVSYDGKSVDYRSVAEIDRAIEAVDRDIAAAEAAFAKGVEMMKSGDYDLIVMDEINIALRYDYLSVTDVIAGLEARDKRTGVILTGRDAKPELCEFADLVTEMTEIKHPFHNGIKAQRGVDF